MDTKGADHLARVRHLREEFASANERLVKRLRASDYHIAERTPAGGGWTAAQIGWHVATVNNRFADLLGGEVPAAKPLPDDFREKPWKDIAAELPEKIQASAAATPPPRVTRHDAVAMLEASAVKMARAFDRLTADRGARVGVTNALVGTINLYQVGEWAASHIARHDRQAVRALAGP
jgi:uncharacterized damage-inducible protein DinB